MNQQQASILLAYLQRADMFGVPSRLGEAQALTPVLAAIEGVARGQMTCAFAPAQQENAGVKQ